jgi:hypothetical protein
MAWNLADQLNTDMDESLFDGLPSAVDQLRKEEAVRVIDSGGDLNENSKGSFVSGSNIAPLEDIKTRASANSESRRVKAEETSNPLDNFEPVKQAPQPKKELTIGEIVADGYSLIGQVQKLKNGRTGANAREVAREKAIDEQFIGQVYGRMGDLFEERNMDRNLVSRLGALPGGGYRTAEEIDRVDRIRREGAVLKDDNGNEVVIEKGLDWDRAFEADKLVWAQELKSRTKAGAAGGDPWEAADKAATGLKTAMENLTAAQASGNQQATDLAQSNFELAEQRQNQVTNGVYFRNKHRGIQQNLATAITHLNNPKVNYKGVAYDQVDKSKPEDNLSSNDFFVQAATKGMMPTVTRTPTGFNTDALEEYVNYYGVDRTLTAAYNEKGGFDFFEYSHKDKKLTPLLGKAAEAPLPKTESTSGIDKALQEIEAREAVSSAKSREAEIAEIDAEIARVSSLMTERREGGFMPSGYSAPVSGRAKTKEELQQSKLKIQKLEQRRAMLRGK